MRAGGPGGAAAPSTARASSRPATTTSGAKSAAAAPAAPSGAPPAPARSAQPARAAGNTASTPSARSTAGTAAAAVPAAPGARSTTPARTTTAAAAAKTPAAKPATAKAAPPVPAAKPAAGAKSPAPAAKPAAAKSPAPTAKPAAAKTSSPTAGSTSTPTRRGAATTSPTPSPKGKRGSSAGATASGSRRSSPAGKAAASGSSPAAAAQPSNDAETSAAAAETEEEKKAREEREEAERKRIEAEEAEARKPKVDPHVQELRDTLVDRRRRVNELEIATQSLTHLLKAKTATERAESFADKTTTITVDVRRMKKEIDAVRHADRALGQLKDTLENLQKHLRMRRAHIRQKSATIALMEQRSLEYAKARRDMCFELAEVNRDALSLAQAYEAAEQFSITVDPWAALKTVIEIDAEREQELVGIVQRQKVFEKSHLGTLRRVIAAQQELAERVNAAADETAKDLADALSDWDHQRVRLEQNIAHKEKAFDEVQHHLHRGTNFLWTSQMQRADLRPLRELKLACDQHTAKLRAVEQEVNELGKAVGDEETNISRDVEEIDGKLHDTGDLEQRLREANERLRSEYMEVQQQFPMLAAPPLLAIGAAAGATAPSAARQQRGVSRTAAGGGGSPTRSDAGGGGAVVVSAARGPSANAARRRDQDGNAPAADDFKGPSFMKPTAARRNMEHKSAVQRLELEERAKEFRSRRPATALARAELERPELKKTPPRDDA